MVASIPLQVLGLSFKLALSLNASDSIHHRTSRALSIANFLLPESRPPDFSLLCFQGVLSSSPFDVADHFFSLIHPVHTSPQQHLRTLHRPLLSKLISMHCRHRRFLIVSAALTPNSPSLSSVVGFKAKLEHPGDEPAPKRCAIIQYFLGSKVRYPFGHHKKQR